MKHKPVCKKKSDFHGNIAETKPQVWAFLLWKNAQAKINKRKCGTFLIFNCLSALGVAIFNSFILIH